MTLCYSRERAEKFSTRDRWCINHFVWTVNGERVVSQIQNDFTVSPSLSMCFHRTMAARATLQRLNFDRLKTTTVYGNFVIIRYIVIILVDWKTEIAEAQGERSIERREKKRQRLRSGWKKQMGIRQWSERSRTRNRVDRLGGNAFGGEVSCAFAKSSTAIDEGIEFRISGTRGQHRVIGFVANVVPVLLLAKAARRWCLHVAVPTPAGPLLVLPHPSPRVRS